MEKSVPAPNLCTSKFAIAPGKRPSVLSKPLVATSSLAIEVPALCCYARRVCTRNRLDGYEFCSRHILEDKSSPYRQCAYTYSKSGHRCPESVLRSDRRDGYCAEHAYKLIRARKHNRGKKSRPKETPESLLAEVECHLSASSKALGNKPVDSSLSHPSVNDTSSGSEDELSSQLMNDMMNNQDDVDSDAESVDSEQENALKHAGVYTAEEVALIFRDKLIRLQSLYIDQFKRLHHRLREKRRDYLRVVRSLPNKAHCTETAPDGISSKATLDKLSALRRYHRRFGEEALLMRQLKERRMSIYETETYQPPQFVLCEYSCDEVQCTNRVLPLSKYCINHILCDQQQVLYTACGYGDACRQPVPAVSYTPRCQLHVQLNPLEYRYGKREETKEETVDVVTVNDIKEESKSYGEEFSTQNVQDL